MAHVTHATTKGGQDGRAALDDGNLALIEEAHQIRLYSKATRNNIPVTLTVA